MSHVFESMLKDPGLSPVYFIVDALDECDQGLAALVQLISASLTLSDKVKWLVSSRPVVELKNPNTARSLVELDSQSLERPVNAYINHKLSTLNGRDGYDTDTLAEISSEIRQRAMNTFLWVALVFKALDSVEGWDAVDIIKKVPPGLSKLYDHIMTRIEDGNEENRQRCKNVLVATSLAYRPLSFSELAVLAGLLPKINPETIIKKCGSFLTTKENTVYLIHQSAKEYLEANYTSKLPQGGAIQGHADISRRSIDAMSKLRKNIYALPHPGFEFGDITVPSSDPLEGLQYCCVYWIQHLQKSDTNLCDNGEVHKFLQKHLLHWLEALGWMGKTSEGIRAILLLEAQISVSFLYDVSSKSLLMYTKTKKSPNLYAFVHDAKRFALYNRSVIKQTLLQLYCSALVFAPENSIVRRQFEECIPAWIQRKLTVEANWKAALQTFEGHLGEVTSVAFSPDGKQVVSGSYNNTVRLWDAVTGAALQTLEGFYHPVSSVAFSPDGKQVISGSRDSTVQLWDTITGAALRTLEGHSGSINSVAFSPDGKQVVSGSWDNTVQLWDTITGAALQTLKGHSGSICSVIFSPDGKKVVSGSWDNTVRLWDTATGAALQTLKGHSNYVSSVAFSPDGKQIVSGSGDRTVRLWGTAIRAVLEALESYSSPINSVAFSANGKQVVSGSSDNIVRLWDTMTGAVL
jgi:hypothetical protein